MKAKMSFGLVVQLDSLPNAVSVVDAISYQPQGVIIDPAELPEPGAKLHGVVVEHAEHNRQIKIRVGPASFQSDNFEPRAGSESQTWSSVVAKVRCVSAPHVPGLADLRPLGHGGFATVYRARQSQLGREVAVKIGDRPLHDERDRRRFLREAHAAGSLSNHPHVVTVHDSGITPDNRPYLVMELCSGSLADELSKNGALPPERVQEIGIQLADAVATAHGQNILHRDIKPANVLIDAFGTVKLSDFGLAAILDGTNESTATRDALSPHYAAPEAFAMGAPTVQTDIYSLAATLYALLANRPPREIPWPVTSLDHLAEVMRQPVPTISGTSQELMETLRKALDPETSRRTKSAKQFRDELQGHKKVRSTKWIAVAATALVLVGTATFFLLRNQESAPGGLVDCGDANGLCVEEAHCYQAVTTTEGKRKADKARCEDEHMWEAFGGGWLPNKDMLLNDVQKLPEARKFCTEQVMRQRAQKEHGFTSWAVFPVTEAEKPYFHCIAGPGRNGTSKGSVFTG